MKIPFKSFLLISFPIPCDDENDRLCTKEVQENDANICLVTTPSFNEGSLDMKMFPFASAVRGYHVYQDVWKPSIGEKHGAKCTTTALTEKLLSNFRLK